MEEKIVCKVVGAIEFSNLEHDICRVKICKKWWVYLHRLGLAVCDQRKDTLKFRKLATFSKKSVKFPPIQNSLIKSAFEHNFFAKSCECRRWLTLEIDIFTDLTISKESKVNLLSISY
jgi:hypothetical protein